MPGVGVCISIADVDAVGTLLASARPFDSTDDSNPVCGQSCAIFQARNIETKRTSPSKQETPNKSTEGRFDVAA